jgi:hypothetical protein
MDLHRIVRKIADGHPEIADPGDLASLVFDEICPDDYAVVIRIMLRSYVRDVIRHDRADYASDSALVPDAVLVGGPAPFRPSVKVAGIRNEWRRQMGHRIHIGGNEWKLLRYCSYEDLMAAASERRRLAAENTASARRYEKLAQALKDHDAATMANLGDDVLRELLS